MTAGSPRFRMIASSYLLLFQRKRILLSKRLNTGYMDGWYSVPAGHVEDGESLTHALIREAREETGIRIAASDVRLAHTMHRKQEDIRLDFFFTVQGWKGVLKNLEPGKCSELGWYPADNLPPKTIPYIREAIANALAGKSYSLFGWRRGA